LIVGAGSSTSAHRRDEYLQAARIAIDPDRVRVEVDLTAGIAVADAVLAGIDADRDGAISSSEAQAYAGVVRQAVRLDVDAAPISAALVSSAFPDVAALRGGEGPIRVVLLASLPPLGPGRHQIRYRNAHRADIGVYLANALVPASDRVAINGQQRDLWPERFETFAQLREYCYQVAGVVGVASIHIWGFEGGAETEALAAERGVALQLTNILRDLREDAARGRIYLPLEDLAAAGVSEEDVLRGRGGDAFRRLMRFEIDRAEHHYAKSRGLEARIAADSRPTLIAMTDIYHRLLRKVARDPEDVLRLRVSLSPWSKLCIGWKAARLCRAATAAAAASASAAAATAAAAAEVAP